METAVADDTATGVRFDWSGWILAGLLFAIGLFGITLPSMGWFTAVPGDIGDPRFNSVVLEHLFRVAVGLQSSLWDPEFFYPFTGILAFSDSHLGSGVVYVLARLVGLEREYAFDVWYLIGVVATFAAAFYALIRFRLGPLAAAFGAFIFTFGLPILAQDVHAQLIYRFGVPLAALSLWQAFEARRVLDLAKVAFWTAWQFYCAIYLGIFLVYLLAAMTAALWLLNRPFDLAPWAANWRAAPRRDKLTAAVIVAACGLVLAYLLGNYLVVSRRYHLGRSIELITSTLPRWASYLNMIRVPSLKGLTDNLGIPARHEQQMFIGFAAGALVLVGALAARGRRTAPWLASSTMAWALLLLIVGTLWIRHFSFYYLIAWLPGVSSIRVVSRVIVVMLFPMGLLAGIGASVLMQVLARTRLARLAVAIVLALLVVVEPLNVTMAPAPISQWRARQEAVQALLPPDLPSDAIVWVRTGSQEPYQIGNTEIDGMIFAQDHGLPTLNGYSGYDPPGWTRASTCTTPQDKMQAYAAFTGADVAGYVGRIVTADISPCATPAAAP